MRIFSTDNCWSCRKHESGLRATFDPFLVPYLGWLAQRSIEVVRLSVGGVLRTATLLENRERYRRAERASYTLDFRIRSCNSEPAPLVGGRE